MYTIVVDGNTLYSPNLVNEGYSVLKPKLTMELNKSGSLEFTLPPNNIMYNSIQKLKSTVQVFDGDEEIFKGRVLHDEKDFYKRKAVYCEGELAFLLDSIQRPYDYQGTVEGFFSQLLYYHNRDVSEDRKLYDGKVTVKDRNDYIHYSSTQYPNTWDELNEKLINRYGGYLKTRIVYGRKYLDYLEEPEEVSSQTIEFGMNLLDLKEYINADDVFTILIPLGAKQEEGSEERLTIASVNDGKDYSEDTSAINLFGRIYRTNTWDDVTLPQNLLTKGRAYLASGVQMAVSLNMKAVDLHLVNVDTERIKLGDYVRVVSIPHELDRNFQCTKIILDLVDPKNSEYDFGIAFPSLTDQITKRTT
jgi:phage minor structural protein